MEEKKLTVNLTLDNDEELKCVVLTIYKAGGNEYIALSPLIDGEEDENGEVYIYRYSLTDDGQPDLTNIEDDEEYEIAADGFDEWLDACEFDSMNEEHLEESTDSE